MLGALLVALLSQFAALGASAQGSWADGSTYSGNDFVNTGGYMIIGGLTGFSNFDDPNNVPPPQWDASFGFVLKGGARLNPFLAFEAEFDYLSGFDALVDISGLPQFPGSGLPPQVALTLDGGNVTANAVVYFPLGRFQPKGIVGLGGMWAELRTTNVTSTVCYPGWYWYGWYCTGAYTNVGNEGGFVMRFGGGADLYLTDTFALTVEATYMLPFGSISALAYTNLNWGAKFDF
jgi:hypothetical protein